MFMFARSALGRGLGRACPSHFLFRKFLMSGPTLYYIRVSTSIIYQLAYSTSWMMCNTAINVSARSRVDWSCETAIVGECGAVQ